MHPADRGDRPRDRRVHRARRRARDRRGRGDRPRRPAAVRRRADRGQVEHRGGRAVHELRLALPGRAPADAQRLSRAPAAGGGLRHRRLDEHAGVRDPATTEPRHTGPTRNPWDTSRTPGGSSGGSAAAVAAGLVPIAHANDGGGSLRIPAACCGLVGLKPSRGRISRGPDLGDSFLVSDGVLSRTVAETALLLDVLAGYEPGDATWAPRPVERYTLAMRRNPGKLRIAMSLDNALDVDADPEVVHGLHSAAGAAAGPGTRGRRGVARAARRPIRWTSSCRSSGPGSRSGSGSASGSRGARRTRTRSSRCRARCSSTRARCRRPAT